MQVRWENFGKACRPGNLACVPYENKKVWVLIVDKFLWQSPRDRHSLSRLGPSAETRLGQDTARHRPGKPSEAQEAFRIYKGTAEGCD
jgi:hypothetical protein